MRAPLGNLFQEDEAEETKEGQSSHKDTCIFPVVSDGTSYAISY